MAKKKTRTALVGGKRLNISGPFKGSDKNGGREIYTTYDPKTGKHGSVDAARVDYQKSHGGKEVSKNKEVDHKDNNKSHGGKGNLQLMSKSDNVAKGNKNRHHNPVEKRHGK